MHSLQEKFQTIVGPVKHEDGEGWAGVESTHRHYPNMPTECLPPTAIDEPVIDARQMSLVTASSTDVTDVVNPWDLKRGYGVHKMSGTDDMYTGEHADQFYGEVGFVERNNYLDRL